ncbi:MAG: septum site-determining protein MinC [Sporolactobacillus sp.]
MSASMSSTHPLVTMLGRKDGFVLVLDETCAYHLLLEELKDKLAVNQHAYQDGPPIAVKVEAGNRYLSDGQRNQLTAIISAFRALKVEQIESNVMTRDEFARQEKKRKFVTFSRIIRSGQELTVDGNILLVGDVNPGGTLRATGNIYILGNLRGLACAGLDDAQSQAIIAASVMRPSQLRIGAYISKPDEFTGSVNGEEPADLHLMECAYVDQDRHQIVIDKLQTVLRQRNLAIDIEDMDNQTLA